MKDDTRVLALEGVHNFRDYGGYALPGGGRLKRGILWRSAQHSGATDADLESISGVGLSSVFDLRTSLERTNYPCRRPADFEAQIHFSDDPAEMRSAPHLEAAGHAEGGEAAEVVRAMMRDVYRKIAFRPELVAMICKLAQTLSQGSGASLVNCMAGKDRTGIAVATIHLAAGVHRDDVMADYLLTNTAGDPEARIAAGVSTLSGLLEKLGEEGVRVIMGVEPSFLDETFAAIDERHGSVDDWLNEAVGLDAPARERLRAAIAEF